MLTKTIQNWLTHAKQYFFTYKNGFYELNFLNNSPEYMLACLKKMPFVKHQKNAQTLSTNNPFVKSFLRYEQIEEGLWVIYTETENK